jgi:predicted RNA-binding protein with TRAM domain
VAVNAVGDSDKSINVGFIASALTSRPGKPVKVSATDAPEITIRWTAPESDGGSAIQKYFVYVDGVQDGESSDLEYTTSLRLTVGQRHKFRVSAVNGVGESTLSEE